jgi:predicted porin
MFTPLGFSGSYLGGGETDSIRVDNALKYRIQIAQFTVALQHKFGGVTGDANAKTSDQAMVNYESGPFGVTLGYEGFKDTTVTANGAASAPGTVAVSFYDTVAYTLAARYQVGKLAIKGGYEKEEITNPSDPAGDASTTSIYGQVVSAVNVHPMTINGSPVQKNVNVFWIGAGYDVTPRFNVAYGYYQLAQQNFQNGGSTAGDASGKSKFDSILLDYKFTKSFDTYAGYMVNVVSGGLAAGYVYPNNSIIGVGARYFF